MVRPAIPKVRDIPKVHCANTRHSANVWVLRLRLEKRRHRSDLIETFKIISGCYNLQSDLFFYI